MEYYCGTLQVICCNKRILIIIYLRRVVQILYSSMVLRNTLHNQTKNAFVFTNELTYSANKSSGEGGGGGGNRSLSW